MASVEIRRGPTGLRVLLQRSAAAEVEELTEERAHALLEDTACDAELNARCLTNGKAACWWCALSDAVEGLR